MKNKYNLKNFEYSFIITDVLMFCRYCLQKRRGKYKKQITVHDLWRNLYHYDYSYKSIEYWKFKKIIVNLFPLHRNNHKNTKFFKFTATRINDWGKEFNINYKLHEEIFSTFKRLENEM